MPLNNCKKLFHLVRFGLTLHILNVHELRNSRMNVEAVHELGHTYGLGHCGNPRYVMFFSNSLMDTDRKGSEFCPSCKSKLHGSSTHHP